MPTKQKAAIARRRKTADEAGTSRSAEADESTKTYRVRPNNTVTLADPDNEGGTIVYEGGEEVELTEAQAKGMPWAVDSGERRRSGQTSRLKQRIKELETELALAREGGAAKPKEDDPELEAAEESIAMRGDNFIARGEPEIAKVPPDVVASHEKAMAAADFGPDAVEGDDEPPTPAGQDKD